MTNTAERRERGSRLKTLHGAILFVVGVTLLSYIEVELVERVHGSTGALYVASASDIAPVLREWANFTSLKAPNPTDRRALTRVSSPPAPAR